MLALVGRMVAGPELNGSALPTLDTLPAAPAPAEGVPQLVASDLELLLSCNRSFLKTINAMNFQTFAQLVTVETGYKVASCAR